MNTIDTRGNSWMTGTNPRTRSPPCRLRVEPSPNQPYHIMEASLRSLSERSNSTLQSHATPYSSPSPAPSATRASSDSTVVNEDLPMAQTSVKNQRISRPFEIGQFSFAPATQTTVVTTTTTTTTSFPPLIIKAPKHLHDADPKLYPLAASPTPLSLKRFCFDIGGRPTVFREANDVPEAISSVRIFPVCYSHDMLQSRQICSLISLTT